MHSAKTEFPHPTSQDLRKRLSFLPWRYHGLGVTSVQKGCFFFLLTKMLPVQMYMSGFPWCLAYQCKVKILNSIYYLPGLPQVSLLCLLYFAHVVMGLLILFTQKVLKQSLLVLHCVFYFPARCYFLSLSFALSFPLFILSFCSTRCNCTSTRCNMWPAFP